MFFLVVDLGLFPGLGLYHLSCYSALGGGASPALPAEGTWTWGFRQEGGAIPRTSSLSRGYRVLKIPPPLELVFPFGSLSIF